MGTQSGVALGGGEGGGIYLKIVEKEALKTVAKICRKNVKNVRN